MTRLLRLHIGTTLAACLLGMPAAHANDLIGCWQAEKITQFLADGRSHTSTAAASLEFTGNEIVSRGPPQQPSEIRYSYAIVRPGVYTATMTAHNMRPDLAGSRRDYEYRVDGDSLSITTYPQTTQPSPATAAVKVESTSRRIACAGKT